MRIIDADKIPYNHDPFSPRCGWTSKEVVAAQPTLTLDDIIPHGRWLGTHDGWFYSYSCSECGAEALTKEETMHDQVCSAYCPNCGAKMDLEE